MVLVDSSVWIDYFRSGKNSVFLDECIEEDILAINDLILTELVPFLRIRKQRKLIDLLHVVHRRQMRIDWPQLVDYQYACLKAGRNGVGIPDLIIAQHAIQNDYLLYSLDRHFSHLQSILKPLKIYPKPGADRP